MATLMWNEETEGEVWSVQPDGTNDSHSLTDSSDTDSTADTLSTIQSDDLEDYFRIEHGRAFPSYEGLPLGLPVDAEDAERHRASHQIAERLAGPILDGLLSEFLAPTDGRQKSVLDIRIRAGLWAEQVAIRFPHVVVKSIDVAPTVPHIPRSNLYHEVYDIHMGLIEPDRVFDVVHARNSMTMLADWRQLLKEIHRVLRPGGLFVFYQAEPRLTIPNKGLAVTGRTSRLVDFFDRVRTDMSKRGVSTECCTEIDSWLNPNNPLWAGEPGLGFRNATHRIWEVPTNALWHPDPAVNEFGRWVAINFVGIIRGFRPLLLSSGMAESEYESWFKDACRELHNPGHVCVVRLHLVCAFKL